MKDVCVLTEMRYLNPRKRSNYIQNIINEEGLICQALENLNLSCERQAWDKPFNISNYRFILFRTTWNYFDNLNLFKSFLNHAMKKTNLINPYNQLIWNLDKQYLLHFKNGGINIPDTIIIKCGQFKSLSSICAAKNWQEIVIKPCVSAAAWNTHRITIEELVNYEGLFFDLVKKQNMIVQEFQENIIKTGEVSVIMLDGECSHAVIKFAKDGDFRVQDDYGGTYKKHFLSRDEISFCNRVMLAYPFSPVYARIDLILDNKNTLALSEIEVIEPELWLRMEVGSADKLALAIKKHLVKTSN